MTSKEFFGKFMSRYLWGNILAMAIVVVMLCVGVKYGLDIYTHHGEGIPVPKLTGMSFNNAFELLRMDQLKIVVADSGYNKRYPANTILAQTPGEGVMVKTGHTVYVTVNSPASPTFAIPDVIDNSSVREATAKLTAMGFRLLTPKLVTGEKDWVYGITSRGRNLQVGDRVPIDVPLTLMIGNGQYDDGYADIDYVEPENDYQGDNPAGSATDEFEVVSEPQATQQEPVQFDPADPIGGMSEVE